MTQTLFPDMNVENRRPIKAEKHDHRIASFSEYWDRLYRSKHDHKYHFSFSKDWAIIKRLLKLLDSENPETSLTRLKNAAERLFNGHLKWFKGMETIGSFSTHINHLLSDDHGGSNRAGCTVSPTNEDSERYRAIARRGD